MRLRFAPVPVVALALGAAVLGGGIGFDRPATADSAATPAPYGAGIASVVYANVTPVPVGDPSLALALVTVEPDAPIATHHHPGTQIGTIAAGELTYTVETGRVEVRRAGTPPDAPPDFIEAGETVVLGVGDTVIEPPTSWHHAVNNGDVPVEIWVATLFPVGAPRTEYPAPAATPVP